MRLGVDLDNTLICYDEAFLWGARQLNLISESWEGGRQGIRQYLKQQPDGEIAWQRLQGQVYGKFIGRARLFTGVYRFLWRCRYLGIIVEVISHKSEYGHFDKDKVPLRKSAREFLLEAGIFSKGGESLVAALDFFPAQEEKIRYIADKEFDWFIDDLPEILESAELPETTKKIGFNPDGDVHFRDIETVDSWVEIENLVLGRWTDDELLAVAQEVSRKEVTAVIWHSGDPNTVTQEEKLGGSQNAGVSRVQMSDGSEAALKIYPDDDKHDRLHSEFEGITLLREFGIRQVPEPIAYCRNLNAGMYSWVPGESISNASQYDVTQALNLVERIHSIRNMPQFSSFPNASAAVFSGHQLEQQIQERLKNLGGETIKSTSLEDFLTNDLKPTANEIFQWCRSCWPRFIGYDEAISFQDRTLSPSDFGFHNALRQPNSRIIFFDFEYFGWDDPAKLIGDFILHPGMSLSDNLKAIWVDAAGKLFGGSVIARLKIMWPLLGLCWCLILLNEFRKDMWMRRTRAFGLLPEDYQGVMDTQLGRSRELLTDIQSRYREFPYG